MNEHIQKQHPTIDLSLLSMVYRRESEPIQAIPVTFPTPPGYVPYGDVDFAPNHTLQSTLHIRNSLLSPQLCFLSQLPAPVQCL